MLRYLTKRVIVMIPVLFGVTLLNYALISMAPGDAVDLYINPGMTEVDRQIQREALGLDQPFIVQYGHWLGELFQGNLGYSFTTQQPVIERVGERIGPTLLLMGASLFVAYLLALPLGVFSAVKQYSWLDYTTAVVALAGVGLPTFFSGLVLIYVFSLLLGWLPTGGMYTLGGSGGWLDLLRHLALPAAVLVLTNLGLMLRLVRSNMLEALQQDYVRTSRAKGLSELRVIFRHAFRNSLIPVITIAAMQLPILLGGAVITEQVFQWPGMGSLTIEAIMGRDYPTLMALNMVAAVLVLLGNFVADILYAAVDPRVRYE